MTKWPVQKLTQGTTQKLTTSFKFFIFLNNYFGNFIHLKNMLPKCINNVFYEIQYVNNRRLKVILLSYNVYVTKTTYQYHM